MSAMAKPVADWTTGTQAIVYQACGACKHTWYFRRSFCPSCGATDVADRKASREGVVHAISVVTRAATPEARAHVPYAIVLIDMAEGFRMMAHGENDLKIDEKVSARFETFAGRIVPFFARAKA